MLILCDIDGTLFDNTHRAHLLPVNAATTEDWEAFNAAHVDDQPIGYRIGLLNVLADEHRVIYITGRTETQRATTEQQLEAHGCPAGRLVMREEGNDLWAPELKVVMVRDVMVDYQMWPCDGSNVVIIEDDHRTCDRLGREFPAAKIVRVPSACCAYLAREVWQARHAVADPQAISSVLSCSADVMERLAEENKQQQARIAELDGRINILLEQRNRLGQDVQNAAITGVVPENHAIGAQLGLVANLRAKVAELERQAAIGRRAVEALKQYGRYVGLAGIERCVECDSATECDPDCELAAILRDAEQVESSNGQGILDSSAPELANSRVILGSSNHVRDATKMVTDRQLAGGE